MVFKAMPIGLLIVVFHVMSYLIYQHHVVFGLAPNAPTDTLVRAGDHDADLRRQAEKLHRRGVAHAATRLRREPLDTHWASLDFHADHLQRRRATDDRTALLQHGAVYLGLLAMECQERRGLSLLREYLDLQPGFPLAHPDLTKPCADRAIGLGQTRLALDLLPNSIRACPRHLLAPDGARSATEYLPSASDMSQRAKCEPTLRDRLCYCDSLETRRSLQGRLPAPGFRV